MTSWSSSWKIFILQNITISNTVFELKNNQIQLSEISEIIKYGSWNYRISNIFSAFSQCEFEKVRLRLLSLILLVDKYDRQIHTDYIFSDLCLYSLLQLSNTMITRSMTVRFFELLIYNCQIYRSLSQSLSVFISQRGSEEAWLKLLSLTLLVDKYNHQIYRSYFLNLSLSLLSITVFEYKYILIFFSVSSIKTLKYD